MVEKVIPKMGLMRHPEVLREDYIPKGEELLFRDKEIKRIGVYFGYVLSNYSPPHILVLGVRGSGKTAIIQYLLKELRKELKKLSKNAPICLIGYTIKPKTAVNAMVILCNSMGIKIPSRGLSFDEIITRWEEKTKGKISIMVIDEIDTLPKKDLNELLYHLTRRGKTCVIGITRRVSIMERITDPSVQSSFMPRIVMTAPYTAKQLQEILKKRAEVAFNPNTVGDGVIELCSALASKVGGDCRYGIQLLYHGADRATAERAKMLKERHIKAAQLDVEKVYLFEGIKRLKYPHKILIWGVLEGYKELHNLYDWYNNTADFTLSPRRLSGYLSELEYLGYLLKERESIGKGKGVKWFARCIVNKELLRDVLKKDSDIQEILRVYRWRGRE